MVTHIVMWKLKENAEGKPKIENAKIMKQILETLKNEISGIINLEAGIDFLQSEQSFDIALYSTFVNQEALDAYQIHPKHIEAGKFIKSVVEQRVVVDYNNN